MPLLGPFFSSLALVTGYKVLRELGINRNRAVAWAMVTGVTSIILPMSRAVGPGPLSAFLLMALLHSAVIYRKRVSKAVLPRFGLILTLAVIIRPCFALTLPVFTWFFLAAARVRNDTGKILLIATSFVCGTAIFTALFFVGTNPGVLHKLTSLHRPWNIAVGVWAVLMSPGKSLLLYSPVLLLTWISWKRFNRRDGLVARLVASLFIVLLLFFSIFQEHPGLAAWLGDPAAMLVILALVPMAFIDFHRWWRFSCFVILVGLIVQTAALSIDHNSVLESIRRQMPSSSPVFDPNLCPLHTTAELLTAKFYGRKNVVLGQSCILNPGDFSLDFRLIHRTPPEALLFAMLGAVILLLSGTALATRTGD